MVKEKFAQVINPNQSPREIRAQTKFLESMLRKLGLTQEEERELLLLNSHKRYF